MRRPHGGNHVARGPALDTRTVEAQALSVWRNCASHRSISSVYPSSSRNVTYPLDLADLGDAVIDELEDQAVARPPGAVPGTHPKHPQPRRARLIDNRMGKSAA